MVTQIDLKNNKSYRIAAKGEGPNEFINIKDISYNSTENCINFFDGATSCFTSYRLNNKGILHIDTISSNIRIEKSNFFDIISFNNGYIVNGLFNKKQLCYFDKKGNTISEFGVFPGDNNGIEKLETFFLKKQTMLASSPNQQNFAVAGVYNDQLAFYKANQNEPQLVKEYYSFESDLTTFGNETDAQYGIHPTNNTVYPYKSIYATDKHLYVTYWGYTQAQLDQEKISGCLILVFNWNGNKIKCFKISELLLCIAADEKRNCIYGLTFPLNSNSKLIKYEYQ